MAQSNTQHAEVIEADEAAKPGNRPVETVRVGNVEIAIWRNQGSKGDFYSASAPTIRYKDEPSGEWKNGTSYGAMDLLALSEAAREASAKVRELQKGRGQQR